MLESGFRRDCCGSSARGSRCFFFRFFRCRLLNLARTSFIDCAPLELDIVVGTEIAELLLPNGVAFANSWFVLNSYCFPGCDIPAPNSMPQSLCRIKKHIYTSVHRPIAILKGHLLLYTVKGFATHTTRMHLCPFFFLIFLRNFVTFIFVRINIVRDL